MRTHLLPILLVFLFVAISVAHAGGTEKDLSLDDEEDTKLQESSSSINDEDRPSTSAQSGKNKGPFLQRIMDVRASRSALNDAKKEAELMLKNAKSQSEQIVAAAQAKAKEMDRQTAQLRATSEALLESAQRSEKLAEARAVHAREQHGGPLFCKKWKMKKVVIVSMFNDVLNESFEGEAHVVLDHGWEPISDSTHVARNDNTVRYITFRDCAKWV
jgi:hypothetical protein